MCFFVCVDVSHSRFVFLFSFKVYVCVCVYFVRGISHAIVGFTMRFHRIEVAMRAKSNRLLLSVATMHVHPACCSKRDFFIFSIAGVFVSVCVCLWGMCWCSDLEMSWRETASTTATMTTTAAAAGVVSTTPTAASSFFASTTGY